MLVCGLRPPPTLLHIATFGILFCLARVRMRTASSLTSAVAVAVLIRTACVAVADAVSLGRDWVRTAVQ
jgi:hypothetical protein